MTAPAALKNEAKRLAKELHKQFGTKAPIDLEAIAHANRIDIRIENLEDEVSGMLVVRDGSAVIGVNGRHHPNRRRFTIAHELGHYLLHRDDARFFIDAAPVFYRSDQTALISRDQELTANAFAAELLLPESVLKDAMHRDPIDVFDDAAVKRMADRFGVSSQALLIRLQELDLVVPQQW